MIEKIVQYTNEEIAIRSQNYTTKHYYLGPTNVVEIRAIIGLYLKAGIYPWPIHSRLKTVLHYSVR